MLTDLPSFDGNENTKSLLLKPDRYSQLFRHLNSTSVTIPRGAGLSYCGASSGTGISSISSLMFNRILQFDENQGIISMEPGMRVGELFNFAISHGWYPPVLPGHPTITLGGCLGCNVHGKSQFHGGTIDRWVRRLTLYHPDYGELECSPTVNAEIFDLTLGGFGLTGFITAIELQLQKLKGQSVLFQRVKVDNLLEAAQIMRARATESDTLYSWNNLNSRGSAFGKGFVYIEKFEPHNSLGKNGFHSLTPQSRGQLPFGFYNRIFTPLVLSAYEWQNHFSPSEVHLDLKRAAFPLDGKEIYFYLFGKQGFREYQFILPTHQWEQAIPELEKILHQSKLPITLGSMKLFRGKTQLLHFCADGICLAIDIPARPQSVELFKKLDSFVIKYSGILNISKDSRATADTVKSMYLEYGKFKKLLNQFDPKHRFDSSLRRRLDV